MKIPNTTYFSKSWRYTVMSVYKNQTSDEKARAWKINWPGYKIFYTYPFSSWELLNCELNKHVFLFTHHMVPIVSNNLWDIFLNIWKYSLCKAVTSILQWNHGHVWKGLLSSCSRGICRWGTWGLECWSPKSYSWLVKESRLACKTPDT